VLFFIELASRRGHFGGLTANPNGRWVTQQARNLAMTPAEAGAARALPRPRPRQQVHARLRRGVPNRGHPRDQDSGTGATGEGARRALGGKPARECLDRILIVGRRQLEQVVRTYIRHHNEHRPHRSLEQRPPLAKPPPVERPPPNQIGRRDRLGGLIHEYYAIAA
jgi:hypothetical protein